jgi:hypothetical protein
LTAIAWAAKALLNSIARRNSMALSLARKPRDLSVFLQYPLNEPHGRARRMRSGIADPRSTSRQRLHQASCGKYQAVAVPSSNNL